MKIMFLGFIRPPSLLIHYFIICNRVVKIIRLIVGHNAHCEIWFMWHYNHSRVGMVITNSLVHVWRGDIRYTYRPTAFVQTLFDKLSHTPNTIPSIGRCRSSKNSFIVKAHSTNPFLPEASFGLRVLSSPLSVYLSVCVYQSLACPHDNSSAVQARITKFET